MGTVRFERGGKPVHRIEDLWQGVVCVVRHDFMHNARRCSLPPRSCSRGFTFVPHFGESRKHAKKSLLAEGIPGRTNRFFLRGDDGTDLGCFRSGWACLPAGKSEVMTECQRFSVAAHVGRIGQRKRSQAHRSDFVRRETPRPPERACRSPNFGKPSSNRKGREHRESTRCGCVWTELGRQSLVERILMSTPCAVARLRVEWAASRKDVPLGFLDETRRHEKRRKGTTKYFDEF